MLPFYTALALKGIRDLLAGEHTQIFIAFKKTFGRGGTDSFVGNRAELVPGKCFLNGKPISLKPIRFDEKPILWMFL